MAPRFPVNEEGEERGKTEMSTVCIDSYREGLEPHDLGVCNLSLKDSLESGAKMTSRRARDTISGSI